MNYAIRFNHAYHQNCMTMLWFEPNNRDVWRRRAAMSRELLRVWEELAVVQDDDGEEGDDDLKRTRADALARLMALLGEEDFAVGRMPSPVPLWQ